MLKVKLSKKANKFLAALPTKQAKQIVDKIDEFAKNPNSITSIALKGYENYERATVGEYRFIFRIEKEVLILNIIIIGKRNDDEVYRIFKRIVEK